MVKKQKKLLTSQQAKPRRKQHTKPCSDCPWARTALPGWLGSLTAREWLQVACGETLVPCHTVGNQQCAGLAIFRTHICKSLRPQEPPALSLPANRQLVFANPREFELHHSSQSLAKFVADKLDEAT